MPIIATSSFKGGTAKTSSALHLAAGLALLPEKKVLVVDFDAQANLTAGLGFDPDEHDSLAPVLLGKKEIQEVILTTEIPGLELIPADTWLERVEVTGSLATDRYSHERLRALLRPLEYDAVIIDTPPSLCWLTESALIAADHTLICATPEFYSVKGLERLAQFIQNIGQRHALSVLGVLLSFWNPRGKSNKAFLDVIERTFPGKILSQKIRRDIAISEASVFGKPVFYTEADGRAAADYRAMVDEIVQRLECKTG